MTILSLKMPEILNLRCDFFISIKVYVLHESPALIGDFYAQYNGLFNLTSTFHTNSDFTSFYVTRANFEWAPNEEANKHDYISKKVRLAVALISHCNNMSATSARLQYIDEMRKHINVDVIGKCGITLSTNRKNLSSIYKFYLSFENNFCKDYITEKFFDALQFDIVPVVLGDGPYEYYVRYF